MGTPLSKAEEFLTAAKLAANESLWDACAVLCYASLYWAAITALEKGGFHERRWSHGGLKDTFTAEVTQKKKLYPPTFGRWLKDAYDLRVAAQYRASGANLKQARRMLSHVDEFVAKVKERCT